MRRALELAEQYRGRTSPNPIVGAVIVDRAGKVIAEGAHKGPGNKHGEAEALAKLGGKAPGGTLYVNLEPCTHQGRTPPCTPAVIASGVARVVIGSQDPFPGHGGGIAALRKAKIKVDRALVAESDAANRPFLTWAREERAAFTLKAAITLDGKIATVGGESQWITGEAARADVHRLRDLHDAVLVGVDTVIADDPRLSARLPGARDPVRVVVDSMLRTPPSSQLLPRKKGPRTIIATTSRAPAAKENALVKAGAEVWRFDAGTKRVPLKYLAMELADQGILSVLVEGGGEVHASLLASGLADEVVLYIAPKLVGGPAPSWVGGKGIRKLAEAYGLTFEGPPVLVGEDLKIRAVRKIR
ncbi:MAG: bifunctional diaminohydroxyphosphoribosylaminopyrimidine deaminase/5-amino-6-(5-phosphoribosylamino)uracil reductase RibD [Kofleriaceae bacterium]|nr:bifunctional diaminohydroxyphosphoribosylaminopyrimidine deaminase/5-amino-6-(5-phosphoribosylamino)uracil reductase RibD [Kofleriaceae bacterium]